MGSIGPGSGQKTAQGVADLLAQLGREEAPGGGNYFPVRVWENWEKQERKEGGHGVCNLAADSRTNKDWKFSGISRHFGRFCTGKFRPDGAVFPIRG